MQIEELDKFQITKAINFNTDLNPQLFVDEVMRPEVHRKLIGIADHFREFLGVELTSLVDITLSGSNAAYSYTPHSDVDLHLIVDFSQLPDNVVYRELFDAKKYQYNEQHDIKIKGYDVELYVQDAAQPHVSLGNYSVFNNEWNRFPTKQRANVDEEASFFKYNKLKQLAIRALAADNRQYLDDVLDIVKRYRRAGLSQHGEFGPENLAFKMLRKDGYFDKLWDKKRDFIDTELSLEHVDTLDTDLEKELAAEFKNYGQRTAEDVIKELYAGSDTLFDDCDYDTLHERAGIIATMEAAYSGNLGAMETFKFFQTADKSTIDLVTRLIAAHKQKEAWEVIQKATDTELVGKEFHTEDTEMLDEDRAAHIVDKQRDDIMRAFKRDIGGTPTSIQKAEEVVHELSKASTKALQWIVYRYIGGSFKLEDVQRVNQDLIQFAKIKPKLPPEQRDLNRLSMTDLYDILDKYSDEDVISNKEADRQKKNELVTSGDAEIIYKDKELVVLIPKTEEASCYFGKGTKWCTASAYGGDNYFEHYSEQGDLYIIMT